MPLGLWNRCRIWSIIEDALGASLNGVLNEELSDRGIEIRKLGSVVTA
jgi:hypothetical protein